MQCPLCNAQGVFFFHTNGIPIEDCAGCGHRFAAYQAQVDHVASEFGDQYFFAGGAGYSDYLSEAKLLRKHGRRYAKLLSHFTEPGSTLDIGCAAGFSLQGMVESGWHGVGLEPNATMAKYAREENQLKVLQHSIEECPQQLGLDASDGNGFDLLTWIQVLPHFVQPRRAFQRAAQITRDGGLWLIETWDYESAMARLLGHNWHEYSPPNVLHWFTPESVGQLASDFGFEEIARGRPKKFLSVGHAHSLLREKAKTSFMANIMSGGTKLLPKGMAVRYPALDLFWILLRKSASQSKI